MPGPDSALVKVRSQAALKKALVAALLSLDEEDRRLLAMHHLDGIPHGEIGKAVKTPRSTVAWRLDKARQKVLEATKRNLRESGLQQKEIDSLFGVLRSQVDISLSVLKST